MAVSIDTVYQRVLTLANKEQRGYITPQEFNLFANHAQMSIFEQYFYDINQFSRIPGNDTEYSDVLNILNEKISIFKVTPTELTFDTDHFDLPFDLYRLGTVIHDNTEVEEINDNELLYINKSPLMKPSLNRPVYVEREDGIYVYPTTIETTDDIGCTYIRRPAPPRWAYTVINGEAQFNGTRPPTVDFELHPSDENDLVLNILKLAGITIKDPSLYQVVATEENINTQQEKQ